MANAQDVTVASRQNDAELKVVDADGHETDMISVKSTTCERFSIRGYVATIRQQDRNACWPFPQHFLETRLKETGNMALPPLEIPNYRWWNCENCLGDIGISSESPCAKECMKDSQTSIQTSDGNHDRRCLMSGMHLPTSSVDIQEKLKENILDNTVVDSLTVELKSSDAVRSFAYQTSNEKKDEGIVTDFTRENVSTENAVPVELDNDKSEIADLDKNIGGTSHCLSNSRNDEEVIDMTDSCPPEQNENAVSDEVVQAVMETMSSMLLSKKRNELGSKQSKSEHLQILTQSPNSWECFSRNKNVFKEIGEKMKGKEWEQTASPILNIDNSSDANQSKNINNVPGSIPYAENIEPGQRILQRGDERTPSMGDSLRVQTMDYNIHNGDDSHRGSDTRIDVPFSNSNESSCSDHININKITEVWNELSNSQTSLEKENMLLSEQTGKLKVSESRSKKKPQKMRSIADIIASKPSCPGSWSKESEEYKSHDEKEENICMTENNEKSSLPREDHMEVTIDPVKNSSKPTIDRNGICEVNSDAEMNSLIVKKRRPEKLEVRKKQLGIGTECPLGACSTFVAKNSSTPSLSQAVTNALQMSQGTSPIWFSSRDKAPQHDFLNPEYEQSRQKLSVMEEEIPMDIVELMAKNQHERGLSNLKHSHESHNRQKEGTGLKMKKAARSRVNQHVGGETGLNQNTAKIKTQPNKTGKVNLLPSRDQCQSNLLVDYGRIDVSQTVRDNSIFSDKEGITYGLCEGDLARLQSTQWLNPLETNCRDFVPPVLDETVSACNLPFPIDGTKSHVAISHCDQYGAFSTNGMALESMQLLGASSYFSYMEMQNLCREGAPPLSYFTNPVLPVFQNKSESFLNYNGHSHQSLTNTNSPQNLPWECSDLGVSGSKFNIPSEPHKENGIPNFSVRTDGISHPLYFNGQSNSALLQQVNAQARQTSGKKYCFPSAPVLRLMGQSVSIPATCADKTNMAAENRDNRNFSNLPQGSSQKHVSWFHPASCASSGLMERYQNGIFSGTERMFRGSEPIEGSTHMHGQIISSVKTIPPVPKFMPSVHLVSNGLSGISTPSCTVPGKGNNASLESSLLRTKSPFQGTFPEEKEKGLPCTSGYNGNLQTYSIVPLASQSTKVVKGSSCTKGLRSYRPTPTSTHLNRYQRSDPDIHLQNGHKCLQSPWVLGSNPRQNLNWEPKKTKALNKKNVESSFCNKKACNVEICALNQNPAEINIEEEEDGYNFGYDHPAPSHRDFPYSDRKINMAIPQGQKRRRTLKKKHLQEFLVQKDAYVGELGNRNVDNLDSVGQEVTSVNEGDGNNTVK